MKEIKSPLKENFLLILEKETLLVMFKPKDIWSQFVSISDQIKRQTYVLLRELVNHGYLEEIIDITGMRYYSETTKLGDFRFDHCKNKAIKILNRKLEIISHEYYEKLEDIQLTKELLNDSPELYFCLKNYIDNTNHEIKNILKRKDNINNILKKIEYCIY